MDSLRNVVIIGGGPAGLSAAIYASRAGLEPIVFAGSPPGGQLMLTSEVENYPGYRDILGPQLVETFRNQAKAFGTEIIDSNVTSVDFSKKPFTVTYSKNAVRTRSVIIATGAQAIWLGLESEKKLRGRGVSACATCDGFFFKNKNVAIVGGGDSAMEEAQTLTKFANTVYLIHRREGFRASKIMIDRVMANKKIIVLLNNEITEILGENKVEGITLRNPYNGESNLTVDGVFVAIGHKPDTGLFKDIITLDEKGYVVNSQMYAIEQAKNGNKLSDKTFNYNYFMMTSIPGIFSGGDCVDHVYRQASTAVGMGVAAALDTERWLTENQI
ncbi:thioredoxin-disulfide reductase [soil metagenome]